MTRESLNGYPLIPPFLGHTYGEIMRQQMHLAWDLRTAKVFFSWFQDWSTESTLRLQQIGLHLENASRESAREMDTALTLLAHDRTFMKPVEPKSILVKVKGVEIELRGASLVLSESGQSICFDLGIAFGNLLLSSHPTLKYEIVRMGEKVPDAFKGLPAIFGFPKRVHLYAPAVTSNCAYAYLDGASGRILTVFDHWDRLARSS